MPQSFYVSGILFHPESQHILLHQPQENNNSLPLWSMFGGTNDSQEDGAVIFQQMILDALNLKLPRKNIYPVYDYFNNTLNKMHYVYSAHVAKRKDYACEGEILSWFTFKQTLKLRFAQETKQDIVVAQRVIDMQERVTTSTQYYRS